MSGSGGVRDGGVGAPASDGGREFLSALSRHRRRGCCVLVYGDLPTARRVALSRRHLGSADRRRYRVFGLTDVSRGAVAARLPPGTTPDDATVAVVGRADWTRDCRSAERTGSGESADDSTLDAPSIPPAAGAAALGDAMARIEPAEDGFDPAELRVCVDSLAPFVDDAPLDDVRAAVRRLAAEVRAYRGLCHAFLPVSADHDAVAGASGSGCRRRRRRLAVAALGPLFEVEIEMRRDGAVMRVDDGGRRRAQAMPLSLVAQYRE